MSNRSENESDEYHPAEKKIPFEDIKEALSLQPRKQSSAENKIMAKTRLKHILEETESEQSEEKLPSFGASQSKFTDEEPAVHHLDSFKVPEED